MSFFCPSSKFHPLVFTSKLAIHNVLKHKLGDASNTITRKKMWDSRSEKGWIVWKSVISPICWMNCLMQTDSPSELHLQVHTIWRSWLYPVSLNSWLGNSLTRQLHPRGAWIDITLDPPSVLLKGGAQWRQQKWQSAKVAWAPWIWRGDWLLWGLRAWRGEAQQECEPH